ncbi:MAG: Mur ligase domain-containing protein, partial [Parascardovia denticolens]
MISMTLAETAQAMSGKLLVFESASASIDSQAQVDSAVTDSRQVRPGSLFVAIKGERVDGHAYLEQAAAAGAVAAVVDHEVAGASLPQILVEDTVRALGFLARHN